VVVPAGPSAPFRETSRALAAALGGEPGVAEVARADVDRALGRPGAALADGADATHDAVVAWLSACERAHRHVVLEADDAWTPWTQRCLRQADRVLVVARAGDDPAPGLVERAMREAGVRARVELVLVHDDACARPTATARWLAGRDVATHHPPAPRPRGRTSRGLARRVSGPRGGPRAGGGGARGFAHIGMLRALAEDGVEIDAIGGTSIGALIAGAHAHGLGVDAMIAIARDFASPKKLLDRTLPLASLMAARKVTALYQHLFGDVHVEDLWTPLFAVSSSLSRARAVVHRSGPLWRGVRASTAIPAIFPPMLADDGDVLVDGNVMNNMPLDVMRDFCGGRHRHRRQPDADDRQGEALQLRAEPDRLGGAERPPALVRVDDARALDPRERDARDRDQQREPHAPAVVPRARRPARRARARELPDPRVRPLRGDHRDRVPERARGAGRLAARVDPRRLTQSRHAGSSRSSLRSRAGHATAPSRATVRQPCWLRSITSRESRVSAAPPACARSWIVHTDWSSYMLRKADATLVPTVRSPWLRSTMIRGRPGRARGGDSPRRRARCPRSRGTPASSAHARLLRDRKHAVRLR
jgi:hypothetical protein